MSKLYKIQVTGTTTINHGLRLSMGLTYVQYIVMDYLWRHRKIPGLAQTEEIYYAATGLDEKMFLKTCHELVSRNYITFNREILFVSQWLDHFSGVEQLQVLLDIFKNKGNKIKSEANLTKALTMTTIGVIIAKAKEYMESVKDSDRKFILSLESWLDPKLKRWEQVFIEPKKENIVSWKK